MMIIVSTVVPAPVEPVWQAYTTAEDILQWNAASSDWHTTAATLDLRPGGTFSYRMEAKDGSFGFDFAGEYTQVLPLQRIEYQFGDWVAQVVFRGGGRKGRRSRFRSTPSRPTPKPSSGRAGRPSWTTSGATWWPSSRRREGRENPRSPASGSASSLRGACG